MQFTTIVMTLAAAVAVTAYPGSSSAFGVGQDEHKHHSSDDHSATGASKGATCAVGSQVSCCTTDSSGSDVLGNVLGGSCLVDNLSLISILNSQCPGANTFCKLRSRVTASGVENALT